MKRRPVASFGTAGYQPRRRFHCILNWVRTKWNWNEGEKDLKYIEKYSLLLLLLSLSHRRPPTIDRLKLLITTSNRRCSEKEAKRKKKKIFWTIHRTFYFILNTKIPINWSRTHIKSQCVDIFNFYFHFHTHFLCIEHHLHYVKSIPSFVNRIANVCVARKYKRKERNAHFDLFIAFLMFRIDYKDIISIRWKPIKQNRYTQMHTQKLK